MDHFEYRDGILHAENVSLADIAGRVGTPCYVYSRATLERHWNAFDQAPGDYPHQIYYAVKANGNLAVLNLLARLGSGFDIVSGGELARVQAAGGDPALTVFSGVGKLDWEIRAGLEAGIKCFNIESDGELQRIASIAEELGKTASIAVRINPDVDAGTHPYISTGLRDNKFGLVPDRAFEVYQHAEQLDSIKICGIACHIGSQLTEMSPYIDALQRMLAFINRLSGAGILIDHIDFGGGLGVRYADEIPPTPERYWQALQPLLRDRKPTITFNIEPGRAIVANAGVLLTRVSYLKRGEVSNFCVVDAAMNDLIRPALYQAWMRIDAVDQNSAAEEAVYDVVGPICESSDFLGKQRQLKVDVGDLVAVRSAGAYAASMMSNYNARQRPAEVMVDGDQFQIVREREPLEALYQGESVLG